MKKITATILSVCALAALSLPPVARQTATVSARAESASVGVGLPFQSLTGVAATTGYTAVSSGSTLYLYNHEHGEVWQEYAHSHEVMQLRFGEGDALYFLDAQSKLYTLSLAALDDGDQASYTGVNCSTFHVESGALYYANGAVGLTTVSKASLSDVTATIRTYPLRTHHNVPSLAVWQGTPYAIDGAARLYRLGDEATEIATLPRNSYSVCVAGDELFSLTSDGDFYGYDFAELAEKKDATICTPVTTASNVKAMATLGNAVHLLKDTPTAYDGQTNGWSTPSEYTRPTVKTLPVGDLKREIEGGTGAFTLVKTTPQALLMEVDFTQEGEIFPLLQTARGKEITALKIGETAHYALLAYRKNPSANYQTFLVAKNGFATQNDLVQTYATAQRGYATSAVSLYKFPHLALPKKAQIARGEELVLLGEVRGLDCEYYEVRHGERTGYIPKSYVVSFDGSAATLTQTTVGSAERSKDGVWRMAYLLLGAVAIGVLVDFLILRKKPND